MFNCPLNISELCFPIRPPVRATLALVRRIQRGLAEPASIISEDGDPFLRVLDVSMGVSAYMFGKAVNENEQGLGLIGLVGPGIELGSSGAGKPALFERGGGHEGGRKGMGRALRSNHATVIEAAGVVHRPATDIAGYRKGHNRRQRSNGTRYGARHLEAATLGQPAPPEIGAPLINLGTFWVTIRKSI